MGGPGSGGRRPGVGRKPDTFRAIDGGVQAGSEGGSEPVQVPMPEGLSPEVQEIWQELAPLATERQTLNRFTARAFKLYCQNIAREEKLGAFEMGSTDHRGVMREVRADSLRFDVAPNGKPHGELVNREKPKSALEKLKERRANLQAV